MSFFQRPAHRLTRDAPDASEGDQPIGQELQGPAATASGRIAAGQLDQLLLDRFRDLHLLRSRGLGPVVEGRSQALGHESLADPGDGRGADTQGLDDVLVGTSRPVRSLIGQEQDARVGELAGGGLADGDHVFQPLSLLNRQGHFVFLHRWISFPWSTEARMSIGKSIPDYPSIEG